MRRLPLIWLSIGLVVGVLAGIAVSYLRPESDEKHLYLQIDDRGLGELYETEHEITDDRPSGSGSQDFSSAIAKERERKRVEPVSMVQEAWKCGFREFRTEAPSHGQLLSIRLDPKQADQIRCLTSRINEYSIPFTIADREFR